MVQPSVEAPLTVTLLDCASETISLASPLTTSLIVKTNTKVGVITLKTQLEVHGLFSASDSANCPAPTYELVNTDGSAISAGSTLYSQLRVASRTTDKVEFDTAFAPAGGVVKPQIEFKLKATIGNGNSVFFSFTVMQCDASFLTLAGPGSLSKTVLDEDVKINLKLLFHQAEPGCPISSY